jgi:AcrR family transcriptional regulator
MSDARDPAGLPALVDLLWRRQPTPRRGPRRATSVDEIVKAGIALADAEGLAAVSMARVAERLGLTTMSLYRYVSAKDDLLVLMYDEACDDPPPSDPTHGWREALAVWTRASLAQLRLHPWMLDLPISGPPLGPRQIGWVEAGLQAIGETSLSQHERASAVMILAGYTLQAARLGVDLAEGRTARLGPAGDGRGGDGPGAGGGGDAGGEPPGQHYEDLLAGVLDPDRHPALLAALEAGAFDDAAHDDPDADVEFGLQRILDGIELMVDRAARAR